MTAEEARKQTQSAVSVHEAALQKQREEEQQKHDKLLTKWNTYVVEWFEHNVVPDINAAIARREYRTTFRLDCDTEPKSATTIIVNHAYSLGYTVLYGGRVQERAEEGYPGADYVWYTISW
jgi:hypothetical protein